MNNNEKEVKETLASMGFTEREINQAYTMSDIKTVEAVINKIEYIRANPEKWIGQ